MIIVKLIAQHYDKHSVIKTSQDDSPVYYFPESDAVYIEDTAFTDCSKFKHLGKSDENYYYYDMTLEPVILFTVTDVVPLYGMDEDYKEYLLSEKWLFKSFYNDMIGAEQFEDLFKLKNGQSRYIDFTGIFNIHGSHDSWGGDYDSYANYVGILKEEREIDIFGLKEKKSY